MRAKTAALAIALSVASRSGIAGAEQQIRLATIAPRTSTWGKIRQLDLEAKDRLMKRMTVVRPSDDDKVEWYRVFLKAVKRLRNGIFSRDLIDQVLSITSKG